MHAPYDIADRLQRPGIDRFSRKAVLIGADLVRALLVLSLLWPQGAWHAYLVAAGLAAGNTFFNPTVQAIIPALTTAEQRLAANSVAWSTGRLVQIIASAIAGGLVALLGTGPAFAVNAASFLVSAAFIAALAIPAHAGQLGASTKRGLYSYLGDARDGLAFARHDRFVSRLLLVQALASLAVGATGALLVVLTEQHLRLPPAGFAWLIGAIGVGAPPVAALRPGDLGDRPPLALARRQDGAGARQLGERLAVGGAQPRQAQPRPAGPHDRPRRRRAVVVLGPRQSTEARWRLAVIPGHENRPGGLFPEEQKVGLSDELLAVARQTCEQTGRDAASTTGPLRHKPRVDAGRPTRTIP